MSAAVGIDLGTTNTLVAVLRETGPEVLRGPEGSALLPSAVAVDPAGRTLVGPTAASRLRHLPESGVRWFKRDMGTDRTWTFGGRTWKPTELSALVLREAKAWAEAALGEPVTRAVITVPAYFAEPQRAARVEAAALAGLEVIRVLNEPTAAAIAYGVADAERERRVAVLDLGGGTFDVTLLDIFDGVIEVVGTGGDGRLGGEDYTDALWHEACRRAQVGVPGARPTLVQALLRETCDEGRRALTAADFVRLPLPRADSTAWVPLRAEVLTRTEFAQLTQPLTERLRACIVDTLRAAGRNVRAVDEVVLAGGATRMAVVRREVEAIFGRAPVEGPDPDLAIALGAALQAGLVSRHAAVSEVVVTDVLAHSLGVEVTKDTEDRLMGGYFLPVMHRNTTLPARRTERVYTLHPKQSVMRIKVYAGEHRYVRENQLLGEFSVEGLPPAEGGGVRAVDLRFTHDLNGLLEVEAEVEGLGKKASVVIERQAGRMTPDQKARAVADLARLKVVPRDLLPNRLLLEDALYHHARANPQQKKLLDAALLAFEVALAREDAEAAEAAAAVLRGVLAHPTLRLEEP